ncbi:hypothetical protein LOC67_07565 [Stieleria sp. JC731]|uniref:hypothetical protein n=1 Tax=Pirellulaceae TaxID=2691357 RepID=UPI001E438783|nr:hypothetical protein [Stieleria sp. JC731]MCC9600414.1 hypothetical protein [Stieleria sp. JC731]
MKFDSTYLGPQDLSEDDTAKHYGYEEIRRAVLANSYYLCWGREGEPPLPIYGVTLSRVTRGLFRFVKNWLMARAAKRTVQSKSKLRWGANGLGFRRLLHPNGVILFGKWSIDKDNPYSGYFSKGSEGRVIGRYSTCCSEVRRGHYRSLSLAGWLFPNGTSDENELPQSSAAFITQEDIGGKRTEFINDADLRNAPDVTPWRRGFGFPILLLTGVAFRLADREPTVRQLYEIAELEKLESTMLACPRFMRLTVDEQQPRTQGLEIDFRDEILSQIYDRGDYTPRRTLTFHIEVSDESKKKGVLVQRRNIKNWERIGRIEFHEAVASYNGDFVFHIHHPKWRRDLE